MEKSSSSKSVGRNIRIVKQLDFRGLIDLGSLRQPISSCLSPIVFLFHFCILVLHNKDLQLFAYLLPIAFLPRFCVQVLCN